jgi:hypothetical protein
MKKLLAIVVCVVILCSVQTAWTLDVKTGSISGRMMVKEGLPMANAVVFIFNEASGPPPSLDRYWRVPDEIVKTDAAGKFSANLSDGTYYLGAIKRITGEDIGPLQEGDLFLQVHGDGAPKKHIISNGSAIDVGTVSGAITFKKASLKAVPGITAIEGIVTDSHGKPVENALVFAFLTPAMVGKPLFISEKTGKDGRYILRVDQGGNYYLKIRNTYGGGALKAGEIMGSYGQEKPLAAVVKTGAIAKGINITGINFPGQGVKGAK